MSRKNVSIVLLPRSVRISYRSRRAAATTCRPRGSLVSPLQGERTAERVAHPLLQDFVPSATDAVEGRMNDDVWYDAYSLGGATVWIEDADASDHSSQATGQREDRDVAICSCRHAPDHDHTRY